MSGIAPGADAWHEVARMYRRLYKATGGVRAHAGRVKGARKVGMDRLRAERDEARAEVERLLDETIEPLRSELRWWVVRAETTEAEVKRWQEHTKAREAALSRIARQNDDLRAEVERLRAKLDAARAAWAAALGFAHGGIDQDVCLFCADVQAVTDALGGDA